jgi:hypothetical protein
MLWGMAGICSSGLCGLFKIPVPTWRIYTPARILPSLACRRTAPIFQWLLSSRSDQWRGYILNARVVDDVGKLGAALNVGR